MVARLASLGLLLLCGLAARSAPEAAEASGDFVRGEGQRDATELWVQATRFRYAGTAEDDVFFFAGEADLSGRFEDDLLGLATFGVTFTGQARDDVRLACLRTVVFNGSAERNLTLWGTGVEFSTNAVARGNVFLSGTTVTCVGAVEGDLRLEGAESATLKGTVGGTVRVRSPNLAILPGTRIGGDLVLSGGAEVSLPEGVTVGGAIRQEEAGGPGAAALYRQAMLVLLIYLIFTSAAFTLLQLGVAPLSTQIAAQLLSVAWPRCLMAGGTLLGLGVLLALIGFKLGLGLGFSLLLLAALVLLFFAGQTAAALALARRLTGNRPIRSWAALFGLTLLGLALMCLLPMVPLIGTSLWLILGFQGAGALYTHLRQTQSGSALAIYQARGGTEANAPSTPST
jgi:hypothetical protein